MKLAAGNDNFKTVFEHWKIFHDGITNGHGTVENPMPAYLAR